MISRLEALLTRHRRRVGLVGLIPIVAALVGRLSGVEPGVVMAGLAVPLAVGAGLVAVLLAATVLRRRTPAFLVDEAGRSFRTQGSALLVATGVTTLALVGFLVPAPGELFTLDAIAQACALLVPVLAAGQVPALWRDTGLAIRPDGLHLTLRYGSMTVPWDALEPTQPEHEDGPIRLAFRQPGRVRTSGWVPRRVVALDGGQEEAAAAAIRYYLANPAERALIGTAEGHARFLAAPERAVTRR